MYGFKHQLMIFKHFLVGPLFYKGVESGLRDSHCKYGTKLGKCGIGISQSPSESKHLIFCTLWMFFA